MNAYKIFFCLLISATSTFANALDWYRIEILVFANEDPTVIGAEYWDEIEGIPEKEARFLEPSNGNIRAYKSLPGNYLNLHHMRKLLANSDQYRVITHQTWMQPVGRTDTPTPIRLKAGDVLDNGMYELEGYIGIGRGTYIHFRPDLYFSKVLTKEEEALLKQPINNQQNDTVTTTVETGLTTDALTTAALPQTIDTTASTAQPTFNLELPKVLTVNLAQARRMKSKEIHYIDHPLFGVIVRATPVR